ncbi:hypothetical protein GCM10027047_18560 [Rhodococcus aerolatus]
MRGGLGWVLLAHVVSLTGNVVTVLALPIYVLRTTGSPTAAGVLGFVATVPIVLGGALGGVVVDRLGFRRASVLADSVSGVTVLAIPVCAATVGLPFWLLLVLVFGSGLLDTPGSGARQAMLPELAQRAGRSLEQATGTLDAASRTARLVGAPLAGVAVAAVGPLPVLVLDAATFAVAAVVVRLAAPDLRGVAPDPATGTGPGTAAPRGLRGYRADLAAGLRFVAADPLLRVVVLMVMVTNTFDSAKSSVLLPVYATERLGGAVALGLLVGVMGGGAALGALVFAAVGHRASRRLTFTVGFVLVAGPPYLALAVGAPLPVLLGVFALAGLGAGAINPILATATLRRVPVAARARVFGLADAGAWLGVPVGALGAGLLVSGVGLSATLAGIAVCYVLVSLVPLLGGPFRLLDARPVPGSVPPSDATSGSEPGAGSGSGSGSGSGAASVDRASTTSPR